MQFKKSLASIALMLALPQLANAGDTAQASSFSEALTEGKVSGMLRLRYEGVEQTGKAEDANAITLRGLVGYETKPFHGFSVNAQVYGVGQLMDEYNDVKKGVPSPSDSQYPVVADPEDYDFHQLYIQWANKEHKVKLGRQNIFLDNWRFVGDVRFRQNWAVFNGVSYVNTMLPKTKVTLAHFEQIKRVNTKVQDISTTIANANYKITPSTSLTGYGIFSELEYSPANSTKTLGLRIDGKEKISDSLTALFTAEYAQQDDYKDAANIDADYYRVGAGLGYKGWFLRVDQEMLSGVDAGSSKAFQTTYGTNHLFQGWADLFLGTPAAGIEDTMLIAGGKLFGAKIKAEYHWIDADISSANNDSYGEEFDLGIYYKFQKNVIGSFEYANFKQEDVGLGKPDTEKLWITGIYKF